MEIFGVRRCPWVPAGGRGDHEIHQIHERRPERLAWGDGHGRREVSNATVRRCAWLTGFDRGRS